MSRYEKNKHALQFDTYPASLEKTTAYVKKHSMIVEIKGYRVTRIAINALVSIVKRLSWGAAYQLGKAIGLLMYLLRIRRKIAMTNLDIVYGAKKPFAEKEKIYKASLINFGKLAVNYSGSLSGGRTANGETKRFLKMP
jgi:lauroyl/myristoyl acyltransferase